MEAPRTSPPPPRRRGGTYLLTWTTYGSWLPGAEPGFIGRVRDADGAQHNLDRRGLPIPADIPALHAWSRDRLKGSPTVLCSEHAHQLIASFCACADRHTMRLHIVAIMPTHIHVVVHSNSAEGAESLRFLKGSSAHDLGPREEGRWWTRGGSARLLIDTPSIRSAIEYVRLQDNPLLVWTNTAVANPPAG